MGSRNKVLLASLVSMVMVLSFAIGLVPGEIDTSITGASAAAPAVAITADGATPAGDSLTLAVGESISFSALGVGAAVDWSLASNGSAELVDNGDSVTVVARTPGEAGLYLSSADGADLVNLTIVDKADEKALERIRIIAPANGSRVFVQEGASDVPYAVSSLTNDPADTFAVRYTLNGDPIGQRTRSPYSVNISDITDFITGAGATNTLTAAAASYAAYEANQQNPEFGFSTTSNFSVIEGNFDEDGNALPDNPFILDLGPGDSWVARVAGSTRQVVIVPLADNFAKVFDIDNDGATASIASAVNPEQVVTAFAPAGLIGEGQQGYLVLVAAESLDDLLDDLGDGSIVANQPAETAVDGALFAEVSIIVSDDGGASFSEIETPLAANVVVQIEGTATVDGELVRMFTYGSDVTEPPVFINAQDGGIWNQVATSVGNGVVTASTNTLSVFAPFSTPDAVIINSITNTTAGSSLEGTSQARASGGDTLVVSVSNVLPGDPATLTIGGEAVNIIDATATATGTDYEVTAPVAAPLPAIAASSTVPVNITVNGDVDESILTFVGPSIDSVSPTLGPAAGGTTLTITGEAFTGATATVGGAALQGTPTISDNEIVGLTPSGEPGAADVVVAYANNYAGIVEGGFAYTPDPPFISLFPTSVPDDGDYTVRVSATMGSSFINPESGIDNEIYFTDSSGEVNEGEGADPSQDIPANAVTFVDDTRLDILTPDVRGLAKQSAAVSFYNVYWTTSAYSGSLKTEGLVSEFFEGFGFVDNTAAAYTIEEITPNAGPAAGENEVVLTGDFGGLEDEFQVGPPPPPTPEGRQSFFGAAFVDGEEIEFAPTTLSAEPGTQFELTIYHNRADDGTGESPASITFAIEWDPDVLAIPNPTAEFFPAVRSDLLIDWYAKNLEINLAQRPQGRLPVVISGGSTLNEEFNTVSPSITTFNNQRPVIVDEAGTEQQNPFPLITVTFEVVGAAGSSSPLSLAEYAAADADANPVATNADGLGTTVVIGGSKDGKQAGADLFNVNFGTQAAVVEQAGFLPDETDTDAIEVIAPAVEEEAAAAAFDLGNPFSVDVRVESVDFDIEATDGSETLFGVRKDGYAYQPAARQITAITPSTGWVFGAENVAIQGNGFLEESDAEDISVTFTVVDGDGASVDLEVEPSEVTDTEIIVRVPNLPVGGNFPNRTTPATVTVDFSGDEEVEDTEQAGTFTYVKWDVTGTPATGQVTTNAFVFAADQGFDPGEEGLIFDGPAEQEKAWNDDITAIPSLTTGTLGIPALPTAAQKSTDLVFGILRVTREGELFGISETPPNSDPFPGNEIGGIFNFDLHLYQGEDLAEFFVQYDLDEVDEDDLPSIVYNVQGSELDRDLIATGGVATWSRPTAFDFTFANRSLNIPPVPEDEDNPSLAPRPSTYSLEALLITEDTLKPDVNEPVAAVRTRLVNLGAGSFALRSGQGAPRNLVSALLGATGITQQVAPEGGDEVVITGRNIYWAVNLYAVPAGSDPAFSNSFVPPAVERSRDANTGRDRLVFRSPALAAGNYELYLELPSSSKQTAAELIDVGGTLQVTDTGRDFRDLFRILAALATAVLGGLVALIGLVAGGDSSSSGGPCFIATAAYGTPMAAEIEVLRTFRDGFLLSNPLGAAFVDAYYRMSPALADVVAQSPVLASVIRLLLTPVLLAGKLFMALPAVSFGLMTMTFALAMLRRRLSREA